MSYIDDLMKKFFDSTSHEGREGDDLFIELSNGKQAIVQMPQLNGDSISGRYIIFSTGLCVKHDSVAANSIVWGTNISDELTTAKISDWNAQSEMVRKKASLDYLERHGFDRNLGEEVIERLADVANDTGSVIRYVRSVTLISGLKLAREEATKIVEGLCLRMDSPL